MKRQDAEKLKQFQTVYHRRYGKCKVREVMLCFGELFGVAIRPVEKAGLDLLKQDSGCDIPDFLEDLPRNLSLEEPAKKPGEKPIDLDTAWGNSEDDRPEPEKKNHFAVTW